MDDFDETIAILTQQVSQFKSENTITSSSGMKIPKMNLNSPVVYYSIVPVLIFLGLNILKPSFIMKESGNEENGKELQINYVVSMSITLILSGICIVGFIYLLPMYKKKIIAS
jgi:nitrate reductase gamma subunit